MLVKTWEKMMDIYTQRMFFVKTLRIFDAYNKLIDNILTEQVCSGAFNDTHMYETSTVMHANRLYYFKRHYVDTQA